MDYAALVMIGAFMCMQLGIAFYASRSIQSEGDYLLGGRNLGVVLASFSLFATWFGAETVMASSGAVAASGLSGGRADPFGYTICLILFGVLVAFRMRAGNFMTTSDFYRQRFGVAAEKFSVFLVIPTSLIWSAAQITALSHILASVINIDFSIAILASSFVVMLYTTIGGFMGDVITDFVDGIIVLVCLLITTIMVIEYGGGLDIALSKLTPERLNFVDPTMPLAAQMDQWMIAVVGSLVSQEVISRLLGTKSAPVARTACFVAAGLYLFAGILPVLIGLVGYDLVPSPASEDAFLPTLAKTILPEFGYLMFLAALLSAILSTINTTLLSVGALAGHNLILPWLADDHWDSVQKVRLERGLVMAAAFLTYLIAVSGESIYGLVEMSSSFGSSGLLVSMLMGLWTRFGHAYAAIITMITGMISAYLFQYHFEWEAGYIASLILCGVTYPLMALVERQGFFQRLQQG
ncbi:MAG: sodium:solute symporter [Alphaproteobacteria bacterium]|nr:sodium:solute symporter [Alphaproteobacteria bacterium]